MTKKATDQETPDTGSVPTDEEVQQMRASKASIGLTNDGDADVRIVTMEPSGKRQVSELKAGDAVLRLEIEPGTTIKLSAIAPIEELPKGDPDIAPATLEPKGIESAEAVGKQEG
jgi:hypothetical protein